MEFPESFKQVKIDRYQAPTSLDPRIPFERMDPIMFELFCCDLIEHRFNQDLRKRIFDIQPIAGEGKSQFGADIFVEENIGNNRHVSLYEVKRVKNYNLSSYLKTVQRFLDNYDKWGMKIEKFYLLISNDMSAELIGEWKRQAVRLSDLGVKYEIIPKHRLNDWIAEAPHIIYKYFHKAWVEIFWGKRGLWHIENYGVFNFKEPSNWANFKGLVCHSYENSYLYQDEHVCIRGFLPTVEQNVLSCFVEFRNGKFSHVMTTLNSKPLIDRYFPKSGTPLDEISVDHPFLIKNINDKKASFFCDIGNSRLKLSYAEAKCLLAAINAFKSEYIERIKKIEKEWRSSEFYCLSSTGNEIPLMQIKRGLWRVLLEFSNFHDCFSSTGEWAIFDKSPSMLKVFTQNNTDSLNSGYHVFIKAKRVENLYSNYTQLDDDVILTWMPPIGDIFFNNGGIGPRSYWDVKTTHNWLMYELIPEALKWFEYKKEREEFKFKNIVNIFKVKKMKIAPYNPDNYLTSFFKKSILKNISEVKTSDDLLHIINKLQYFFNYSNDIYIDIKTYKTLYLNLAKVIYHTNLKLKNFSYIISNLNYLNATDFTSLINALEVHANSSKLGCSNSFRIDCILRSYQCCLEDGISNLNEVELITIAEELVPLVHIMEEQELLVRQSKYL